MSWCSRPSAWTAALALSLAPGALSAQGWREAQLFTSAVFSDPAAVLGGIGLGWRDAGRTRYGATLSTGLAGSSATSRTELTAHFLLDPARRRGMSWYGGGGLALAATEKERPRAWLQLTLGAEWHPASAGGFFLEAGAGGGVRVAAGYRLRKRNAPIR